MPWSALLNYDPNAEHKPEPKPEKAPKTAIKVKSTGKRKRRYDAICLSELAELAEKGLCTEQISEKMGVSAWTVRITAKKHGIEIVKKRVVSRAHSKRGIEISKQLDRLYHHLDKGGKFADFVAKEDVNRRLLTNRIYVRYGTYSSAHFYKLRKREIDATYADI